MEGQHRDGKCGRVDRLLQAGAPCIGKTNVPFMLIDSQSYNEIYGTTNNPWDLTRSPGGSSGGEAATLAAGLSALGAGSDIAGSLRNPAHYCGVYGHKPTWGSDLVARPCATGHYDADRHIRWLGRWHAMPKTLIWHCVRSPDPISYSRRLGG